METVGLICKSLLKLDSSISYNSSHDTFLLLLLLLQIDPFKQHMDKELEEKEVEKMSTLPKTSSQSKVTAFCSNLEFLKMPGLKQLFFFFNTDEVGS